MKPSNPSSGPGRIPRYRSGPELFSSPTRTTVATDVNLSLERERMRQVIDPERCQKMLNDVNHGHQLFGCEAMS